MPNDDKKAVLREKLAKLQSAVRPFMENKNYSPEYKSKLLLAGLLMADIPADDDIVIEKVVRDKTVSGETGDIGKGHGVFFIDPHNDAIDDLIKRIPQERLPDVISLNPEHQTHAFGINLLACSNIHNWHGPLPHSGCTQTLINDHSYPATTAYSQGTTIGVP